MSAIEGAFMKLRSTGKKVPRSLSPKALARTEGRFLRFIFNNKGTLGEDCKICKPLDGHVWEVRAKSRPIIPRLEPSRRSGTFTHPHCECRWAEVFADEAYAYEVTREEWENSTIQGKQQQLTLVGGPIEMAVRSWATLPFTLRQRLESLTANTNQAKLFSTKFDDKNLNTSFGIEKSMSWNEATVNEKFTKLLDRGVPFQEAHFASRLSAQEASVVLGSDGNNSTELLDELLMGNIPNTKFMIDMQTPETQGFHPGGVEADLNDPLPLEDADDDPAGRDKADGLMEQGGDDPQVLEPTQSVEECPEDMVRDGEDCIPKNNDTILTEGGDMYEKGFTYEQGANDPLPLESEDDDPAGRDQPDGLDDEGARGDGLNTGKKNLTTSEQSDDDKDEEKEKHMDNSEEQTDDDDPEKTPGGFPNKRDEDDEDADEQTDNVKGLNDDKKDLSESKLTRYFRKQLGETKVRGTELPPCEPGSLLNPDSGDCEPVVDVPGDNFTDMPDGNMEAGTIVEPAGTDENPATNLSRQASNEMPMPQDDMFDEDHTNLDFKATSQLGDPTDAPLAVPTDDFPSETGVDLGFTDEQEPVMDDQEKCGPNQIQDSMGNCVEKQAEQFDDDNFTETWANEAEICRCGEKAWNSAYEVYGANIPKIILNKLPDDLGTYFLTDYKRRRLAGLEFKELPPEVRAGAYNLLIKYPAIINKKRR